MKDIPIVLSTDDNYVLPLLVTLESLKRNKNCNSNLLIYIFYEKLSEESKQKISSFNEDFFKVNFVDVADFFKGRTLPLTQWFTIATYYRLVAPLILSEFDKIIYLDCDLIIRKDINELFSIDLNDNVIGAIPDFCGEGNVNAGVLVFNVKKYIEQNVFDKCVEFLKENPTVQWLDQDALNGVCHGNIKLLPTKFNYSVEKCLYDSWVCRQYGIDKLKDIAIIHYTGSIKPWKYNKVPFAGEWRKYKKLLPAEMQKEIDEKYTVSSQKFDGYIFYHFANPVKKFFIKVKNRLKRK